MADNGENGSIGGNERRERQGPRYVRGVGQAELWAHFPSGKSVPVRRGRARSYPGLHGSSPPTRPFYRAMSALGAEGRRVLDVGCGSGDGTRLLLESFDEVVAIDADAKAIAFAQEHAPAALHLRSAMDEPLDVLPADRAILADVLGHAQSPVAVLRTLRSALSTGARVLIAEPRAYPTQRLEAPARRAYTRRSLKAALTRAGFQVSTWVAEETSFVACVAQVSGGSDWKALATGSAASPSRVGPEALTRLGKLEALVQRGSVEERLEALLDQCALHVALGAGDAATRACLDAAALAPDDARPSAALAELALRGGAPADALELAVRACEIDPSERAAATALARVAEALAHPDAFGAWRVAARLAPDDIEATTHLAQAACGHEDYAFGVTVFERLQSYGDELGPDFHVTLALMLHAEGRRSDALLAARMARALAPESLEVDAVCRQIEDGSTPSGA